MESRFLTPVFENTSTVASMARFGFHNLFSVHWRSIFCPAKRTESFASPRCQLVTYLPIWSLSTIFWPGHIDELKIGVEQIPEVQLQRGIVIRLRAKPTSEERVTKAVIDLRRDHSIIPRQSFGARLILMKWGTRAWRLSQVTTHFATGK